MARRRNERNLAPAPNVAWSEKRGTYLLNLRDQRLTGGRVSLSMGTDDADLAVDRRADFRRLLDAGRYGAIDALRQGKVQWSDVQRAIRTGRYDELQRASSRSESVRDAAKAWLKEVKRAGSRDATLEKYRGLAEDFRRFAGDTTPMDQVSAEQVRQWLSADRPRTKKPWSPSAQAIARSAGKQMFDFAIQRAKEATGRGQVPALTENPFDDVTPAKVEATRVEFLRPEQWTALHEATAGLPTCAMLALGCLAGLRAGEVVNLRRQDVDFEANRIRIQPREGRYAWRPKTANSIRDVPISRALRSILESHLSSGYAGDTYWIVRAKRDQPIAMNTMRDHTEQAFVAAGVPYGQRKDALTFHSLRHTFASWLVQRDVQLMKVAALLGDTVEIVAKVYGHLLPTDMDRAVALIDAAISGTNGGKSDSKEGAWQGE